MAQTYCMKCMRPNEGYSVCPHCGHVAGETALAPHVLRPGTILDNRYLLGEPIGQGGFGITYIGLDIKLDMRVAVKEYYPSGWANRNVEASDHISITSDRTMVAEGKNRFLKEAQVLAHFHDTPGVVDVRDFFEANNTAYIVMEYLEGEDLAHQLKKRKFNADEIFGLMHPVFETLEKLHQEGVIHRDISPDNIMMLPDGSLKLMDFGAARLMNYSDKHSMSVVLKAGYAPREQYYSKGQQGPWTDVYALCATIYKCITGATPDDALDRADQDKLKWPSELGYSISEQQEQALKKGLAVRQQDRLQTVGELQAALEKGPIKLFINRILHKPGWFILSLIGIAGIGVLFFFIRNTDSLTNAEGKSVSSEAPAQLEEPPSTPQISWIIVPNLVGRTVEDARLALYKEGFEDPQIEEEYSDDVESGRIISQSVVPNTEVEKGTPLVLKVSIGKEPFTMPKVVSLKEEEAHQALEDLGLTVNVEYAQYEGEPIGTVVSQEPASGKEIRPGDSVKIVVAAINREIPNISGEKAEDAEKVLREAGFRVIRQESYSNAVAQGRVISQTPEAGSKQLTGSTVTLMICQKSDKGKECFSPAEQFDFAFWLNGSNWEHFRYLHKSQQVGGEFLVYDGGGLLVLFSVYTDPIPDLDKELRSQFGLPEEEESTSWSTFTDVSIHDQYAGRMTENYSSTEGEIYFRCYAAWNTENKGYIISIIAERNYDSQAKAACQGILDSFMTGNEYAQIESRLPKMQDVPNVVGMDVNNALATLETKGFVVWTIDVNSSSAAKWTVINQEPSSGVLPEGCSTIGVPQQEGSLVFLTVSLGQG